MMLEHNFIFLLSRLWFFFYDADSKRTYPAALRDSLGWNVGLCRGFGLGSNPMDSLSRSTRSLLMFI